MLPTNSVSQRCLIPIHIETLAGTSFELLVSPHEQIQYIKRKIERREGIPMTHQHLIWKSTELEDDSCLNDYNIEAGTTLRLVLAMRGGPVNTRRVPIEDNLIRDMSEYIENGRDEYGVGSDSMPSANKNVTFLVLRDGDQYNFFQVIDRGDGTLSPLSGSMSTTSMYNAQETLTVEPDREYDEKRQADDQKTKQKMESIRSKLKTDPRKETHRPPSASKQTKSNLVHHHRRTIRIDTGSNLSTNGDTSSGASSLEQQYRPVSYSYATTNLFNTYHLLATSTVHQHELLHEEDSEDDDEDDDDDDESHDDVDDEQKPQPPVFSSRSFSPAVFSRKTHSQPLLSQTSVTTPVTDLNSNAGLVDYVHHSSSSDKSLALKNASSVNQSDEQHQCESVDDEDNCRTPTNGLASAATSTNMEKIGTETQSRNDTALSKALWTDDEEAIQMSDDCSPVERTATSQSVRFRHSTSTTVITRMPTLPSMTKKSSLPSATQQFYHHYKPVAHDQQSNKSSSRPLVPLSLSKYRRIPANLQMTSSSKQPTLIGASSHSLNTSATTENNSSASSFNEHLMLNKRIETLKTPGKQPPPQSTAPSPASSSTTILPSASSRRYAQQQQQQDPRSMGTTATLPSTPPTTVLPLDSTKVTIETIGPKTVSALLRQNATIEPVDTSRGVGRHLVSLLTTASKETGSLKTGHNKQSSHDAVIEERFKLDSKLNHTWQNTISNNASTVSSSFQSNAATIYHANKLPPVVINRKSTTKCFLCKKKTGLATTYQCRCGSSFCSEHRYPEAHACAFDYKAEGKRLIERNNPLVAAPKLPKI